VWAKRITFIRRFVGNAYISVPGTGNNTGGNADPRRSRGPGAALGSFRRDTADFLAKERKRSTRSRWTRNQKSVFILLLDFTRQLMGTS